MFPIKLTHLSHATTPLPLHISPPIIPSPHMLHCAALPGKQQQEVETLKQEVQYLP